MHSRTDTHSLKFQQTGQVSILLLVATMPLLFGAVHPIVLGLYTAYILIVHGGWLLLNRRRLPGHLYKSPWILFILLFIGWLIITAIPLPMALLEILSPVRASALKAVQQLAGIPIPSAPLNYYSSSGLLTAVFLFALLLYARTLDVLLSCDPTLLQRILYTFAGLGVFEALYGMLQVLNPDMPVLWLSSMQAFKGMARGTIIYKNQYASLLNMCWPLALGAALLKLKQLRPVPGRRSGRKRSRALAARISPELLQGIGLLFLASFIDMAVIFSQSRGGTIAMAVIMILLLVFLPLARTNKIRLTSGLFLFCLFYGSVIGFSSVITRFLQIGDSGLARINLYKASLPMLYDHLVAGIGLEAYELLSPVYLKHFSEHILYSRAHNEYLEFFIELGVPAALLFFGALFAALVIRAGKLKQYSRKKLPEVPSATLIALISLCAVIGFLFHGIADFGWHLPANILYAVTLMVLINHGICRFHDRSTPAADRQHDNSAALP